VEIDEKIRSSESNEKNIDISIYCTIFCRSWNRMETTINDVFTYNITLEVLKDNEDFEPTSVEECCHIIYWSKWIDAIQSELNSRAKCEVLGPIV
jgi:hypothetical protein